MHLWLTHITICGCMFIGYFTSAKPIGIKQQKYMFSLYFGHCFIWHAYKWSSTCFMSKFVLNMLIYNCKIKFEVWFWTMVSEGHLMVQCFTSLVVRLTASPDCSCSFIIFNVICYYEKEIYLLFHRRYMSCDWTCHFWKTMVFSFVQVVLKVVFKIARSTSNKHNVPYGDFFGMCWCDGTMRSTNRLSIPPSTSH